MYNTNKIGIQYGMFFIRKYAVVAAAVLIGLAVTFGMGLSAVSRVSVTKIPFCVVLDAGHGGIDPGVCGVATQVRESDINLQIVLKLQKLFENSGIRTVLTRADENGLYGTLGAGFKRRDMEKRREIIRAANPDAVISVHQNSYPQDRSRGGGQVFFRQENGKSQQLAKTIQNKLNGLCGKNLSALQADYFMLRCTDAPSVLVECGFLSNPQEEKNLLSEEYQNRLSRAIFDGTLACFC